MRAGELRHRIIIRELAGTRNEYYEEERSYSDVATVWAQKITPRGREYTSANVEVEERTVVFKIRYRSDVTTKMIVEDADGTQYDIEVVQDEDGRRRYQHLVCREME
jgi:SPP1 family predicted phage head-tail adaptor